MRPETVLADAKRMLARLVRGCIALAFTARVRTVACIHRLADTVKGGEPSYEALAITCDQTAYTSLLMRPGTVLADPERILARLVRGCTAMAFTARVRTVACSHRLAKRTIHGSTTFYRYRVRTHHTCSNYSELLRVS